MRWLATTVLGFVLASSAGAGEPGAPAAGLRLVATVQPATAPAREPLLLTAAFENRGGSPVRLFVPEDASVSPFPTWRLVREDGLTFAPMPFLGQSLWTQGIQGTVREIPTGGRFEHAQEVAVFCRIGADGRLDADSPGTLEPGVYAVTCAHEHREATVPFGLDAFQVRREPVAGLWTGSVRSEAVRLVVGEPTDAHLRLEAPERILAGDPCSVRLTVANPREEPLALRGAFVVYVSSKMYGSGQARLRIDDGPVEVAADDVHDFVLPAKEARMVEVDLAALSYRGVGRAAGPFGLYERIPEGHVFLQVTFVDEAGNHVLTGNSPLRHITARPPGAIAGLDLVVTPVGGGQVKVALRNVGATPLRVPRRLAYPADLALALTDADGTRPPTSSTTSTGKVSFEDLTPGALEGHAVLPQGSSWDGDVFERPKPLAASDFDTLPPGGEISRVLDLGELVVGGIPPGRLTVRAFWRNLESGRRFGIPGGVVVGVLASEPVAIGSPGR